MTMLKNITAHYRQMLDAIIEQRGDLARASVGRTEHFCSLHGKNLPSRQHRLFVNARVKGGGKRLIHWY